jgi:hypothetical protein
MKKYIRELKKKAKDAEEQKRDGESAPNPTSLLMKKMESAIHAKISKEFEELNIGHQIEELVESNDYWKIKEGERML